MGFGRRNGGLPKLMKNLLKECERLEQKFKDGQQLSEQCRLMKQEGFTGGILEETTSAGGFSKLCAADRHPPLGTYFLQEKAECQNLQRKGRVPEPVGKGKVPLHPQGTPPRNQPKQKARPKPAKPPALLQGLLLGQDRCNLPGPGRS